MTEEGKIDLLLNGLNDILIRTEVLKGTLDSSWLSAQGEELAKCVTLVEKVQMIIKEMEDCLDRKLGDIMDGTRDNVKIEETKSDHANNLDGKCTITFTVLGLTIHFSLLRSKVAL